MIDNTKHMTLLLIKADMRIVCCIIKIVLTKFYTYFASFCHFFLVMIIFSKHRVQELKTKKPMDR